MHYTSYSFVAAYAPAWSLINMIYYTLYPVHYIPSTIYYILSIFYMLYSICYVLNTQLYILRNIYNMSSSWHRYFKLNAYVHTKTRPTDIHIITIRIRSCQNHPTTIPKLSQNNAMHNNVMPKSYIRTCQCHPKTSPTSSQHHAVNTTILAN